MALISKQLQSPISGIYPKKGEKKTYLCRIVFNNSVPFLLHCVHSTATPERIRWQPLVSVCVCARDGGRARWHHCSSTPSLSPPHQAPLLLLFHFIHFLHTHSLTHTHRELLSSPGTCVSPTSSNLPGGVKVEGSKQNPNPLFV